VLAVQSAALFRNANSGDEATAAGSWRAFIKLGYPVVDLDSSNQQNTNVCTDM
jgi:hypothetical protein